jgi:hypothetical protein
MVPPRKPTALLRGDRKNRLNLDEPLPGPGEPPMPDGLSEGQ